MQEVENVNENNCYGPATNKWRITRQDKFY